LNVDLCFVPATHADAQRLPAVSGSSGRLVVEKRATSSPLSADEEKPSWPGQFFDNPELDYVEAMLAYVAASQAPSPAVAAKSEPETQRNQRRQLLRQEAELRDVRRRMRQQRRQEDAAWKSLSHHWKDRKTRRGSSCEKPSWLSLRTQRRQAVAHRQQEDEAWRQQRLRLRQQVVALPLVTAWIAILVVTDNCTRQCLGLPLFRTGPHVTAEMVAEALRRLLPPELHFVITDRGTHFAASAFAQLVREKEFIHVLIARHRPQSNGIAERFVRTLKEWLLPHTRHDETELAACLTDFLAEYNDRPHQGLPIRGLSPNEYAQRIQLSFPSAEATQINAPSC
jgi:transposase InsO family protein